MLTTRRHKFTSFYKTVCCLVLVCFTVSSVLPSSAMAQGMPVLPKPGVLVAPSVAFNPPIMRGLKIFPDNPLKFDFFIDKGEREIRSTEFHEESQKLINYFLAALTLPKEDLWVNLSPEEADRISPELLSQTDMGRDLLAQDYLLKQITASLLYPEEELGSTFWKKIRLEAFKRFGTSEIPLKTLNKVWIVPEYAKIFVRDDHVFVVDSRLKVLADQQYSTLRENTTGEKVDRVSTKENDLFEDILTEIIIPELNREVNEGEHFAPLRQIYNSLILATWYKKNLRKSLLGMYYVDRNKISGIDLPDKDLAEKLYAQYLEAFEKGVYDYIREDYDPDTQDVIARKYFGGGIEFAGLGKVDQAMLQEVNDTRSAKGIEFSPRIMRVTTAIETDDKAMLSFSKARGILRQLILAGSVFLSSMAWIHASHAAGYSYTSEGGIEVSVDEGDTLGGILQDIRISFKAKDPENYKKSPFYGAYWGPDGAVERFKGNTQATDPLISGKSFSVNKDLLPDGVRENLVGKPFQDVAQVVGADVNKRGDLLTIAEDRADDAGAGAAMGADAQGAADAPSLLADATSAKAPTGEATEDGPGVEAVGENDERLAAAGEVDAPLAEREELKPDELRLAASEDAKGRFLMAAQVVAPVVVESAGLAGKPMDLMAEVALDDVDVRREDGASDQYAELPLGEVGDPHGLFVEDPKGSTLEADASKTILETIPLWWGFIAGGIVLIATVFYAKRRAKSKKFKTEAPASRKRKSMGIVVDRNEAVGDGAPADNVLRESVLPYSVTVQETGLGELPEDVQTNLRASLDGMKGERIESIEKREPRKRQVAKIRTSPRYLRVMDYVGMIVGAPLMIWTFGSDMLIAAGAVSIVPVITRVSYAVQLYFHEIAGHLLPASFLKPVLIKDFWTAANMRINLKLSDWAKVLRPGKDIDTTAHVEVAGLEGKRLWLAQKAGFFVSLFSVVGSYVVARNYIASDDILTALLGPWTVAALWSLGGSAKSDLLSSPDKCLNCGNFFLYWFDPVGSDFYPDWVKKGVAGITGLLRFRGGLSAGQMSFAVDSSGRTTIVEKKVVGGKRNRTIDQRLSDGYQKTTDQMRSRGVSGSPGIRGTGGHVRFPTVGKTELNAAHPHRGPVEEVRFVSIVDGQFVETTADDIVYITHNGNNKAYRILGQTLSLDESRKFFKETVHMDERVASGDSPVVALQMHFLITQGVWSKSLRYAYVMEKNDTVQEAAGTRLSRDEEFMLADIFGDVFSQFEDTYVQVLGASERMELHKLWVDKDALIHNSSLKLLHDVQEEFITQLIKRMRDEVKKGSEVGRLIASWKMTEEKMENFAYTAVRKFFTADRYAALREYGENAIGAYGLVVRTSIDDNGVSLFSKDQGLAFGYNMREGFFAGASDHLTLMGEFGEKGKLDALVILNPDGKGEVFDLAGDSTDEQLRIRGFVADWAVVKSTFASLFDNNLEVDGLWQDLVDRGYIDEDGFVTEKFSKLRDYRQLRLGEAYDSLSGRVFELIMRNKNGHEVTTEEIRGREYALKKGNPYYRPLVPYQDQERIVDDDIQITTQAARNVQSMWEKPQSFNRQTAGVILEQSVSRYVEGYLKEHSGVYLSIRPRLLDRVYDISYECGQTLSCSAEDRQALVAQMVRVVRDESLFLSYIEARAQKMVEQFSDQMAAHLVHNEMTQDDLYEQKLVFDQQLEDMIGAEIARALEAIEERFEVIEGEWASYVEAASVENDEANDNESEKSVRRGLLSRIFSLFKRTGEDEEQKDDDFRKADLLLSGYENSQWLGAENLREMLSIFFPKMDIRAVSTNKLLNGQKRHGVHPRAMAWVISKSGNTFPSRSVLNKLESIMPGRLFGITSRMDSSLALALGQKLSNDAPFKKRTIITGDYFPAESATVSETVLYVTTIELVTYLVEEMHRIFPDEKPFGLNVTDEDIEQMKRYRENMLDNIKQLTGFDEGQNLVQTPVNNELKKTGRKFGKQLRETPVANMLFRGFVFGVFFFGAPISALYQYFTGIPSFSPFDGVGTALITLSDYLLAISMPFILTIALRGFYVDRPLWSRLGPPSMTIGEESFLHQVLENKVTKLGAQSIGSMNMSVNGAHPADHLIARMAHRIVRGSVVVSGVPTDEEQKTSVLQTLNQAKTIVNPILDLPILRRFKAGAQVTTIGYGALDAPDATDHHINLGDPDIEGVSTKMRAFYRFSYEALGRSVAYNVMFNEMYKLASRLGSVQLWNRAWTFPSISVHSTESPVGAEKQPEKIRMYDDDQHFSPPSDHDEVGGIDLHPDMFIIEEEGDDATFDVPAFRNMKPGASFNTFKPVIIQMSPVAPMQLQMLLGQTDVGEEQQMHSQKDTEREMSHV